MRTHVARGFDRSAGMPICTPSPRQRARAPSGRGTGMCRVNPTLSARKLKRPARGVSLRSCNCSACRYAALLALLALSPAVPGRRPSSSTATRWARPTASPWRRIRAAVRREAIQSAIDDVLDEVNQHLSTYDARSEISRFNASATTDPDRRSRRACARSPRSPARSARRPAARSTSRSVRSCRRGASASSRLPPATAPGPRRIDRRAGRRWASRGSSSRPTGTRCARRCRRCSSTSTASRPGYAVDRIARAVRCAGRARLPRRNRRRSARPRPQPGGAPLARRGRGAARGERKPYALVELDDLAVSTSGDYRDFRELDGRRVLAHDRPAHRRAGRAWSRVGHRGPSVGRAAPTPMRRR